MQLLKLCGNVVNVSTCQLVFFPMSLREKCPNTEFSGPYFPLFSPIAGKYGPQNYPYLNTFHAVRVLEDFASISINMSMCN